MPHNLLIEYEKKLAMDNGRKKLITIRNSFCLLLNEPDSYLFEAKRKIAEQVKPDVNSTISNLCGGKGGCNPSKGKKKATLDQNDNSGFKINKSASKSFKENIKKAERIRERVKSLIDEEAK